MNRTLTMLALAAVSAVVCLAVAPLAVAATPEMDFTIEPTEASPLVGTGETGTTTFSSGTSCTSAHATVSWTSKTAGHLHLLLTGCKFFASNCNSAGLGAGEVTFNSAPFDLKYIKSFSKTAGMLVTPPTGGVFAEYSCGETITSVKVTGTGLIGHVSKPACGVRSTKSTVSFEQSGGVQTYQEVEGEATKYHLQTSINGGTASESALTMTATTTLEGGNAGRLTCGTPPPSPEWLFGSEPTENNPIEAAGESAAPKLVTRNGTEFKCTSAQVSVAWTAKTIGDLHLLFKGCETLGVKCNSIGLASGEVAFNAKLIDLRYLQGFLKTGGVLVTAPVGGAIAEFTCSSLSVKLTGPGFLGHIDSPACGGKSTKATISFAQSENGVQKYQEVEGEGTRYRLESSRNGEPREEMALVATWPLMLAAGQEGALVCN